MMPAFWRGRAVVGPPHRSTVDALWCIAQHNTQTARAQQSQREEKKHRHWLARISAARLGNSLAEKPFLDAFVSIYFFFRSKQQQQKKFFVHTKAILLFKCLSGCGWWFDCCCCLCSYIVVWLPAAAIVTVPLNRNIEEAEKNANSVAAKPSRDRIKQKNE